MNDYTQIAMENKIAKRRGIQIGQVATDAQAKEIDSLVKSVAAELCQELDIEGLTFAKKLKQSQIPFGVGSCEPDGGVWFLDGMPVFFAESKKQGGAGNAIERWFKNYDTLKSINPKVYSATFCSGEGTKVGGPIWKTLHRPCEGKFNDKRKGVSVFMVETEFERAYVKELMRELILEAVAENRKKENPLLEKLETLYKAGILTEAEFNAKKSLC